MAKQTLGFRDASLKKSVILLALFIVTALMFLSYQYGRALWHPLWANFMGKKTLAGVIEQYAGKANASLIPIFNQAGVNYPPQKLALVAFKDSKKLEIWAANAKANYSFVAEYPVLAASGSPGPKLREGDKQVPEGIYRITGFNPNSAFHLSMKLNYPNPFDLKYAEAEGRSEPGTNIFIHGRAQSIGCLAMGDETIEVLFSLVHATGIENTQVLISPTDPSLNRLIPPEDSPAWTADLYEQITTRYYSINKSREE